MKIKLLVILVLVGILIGTGCASATPSTLSFSAPADAPNSGQAASKSNSSVPASPAGSSANAAKEQNASDTTQASAAAPTSDDNGRMVIRNGDMIIVVKDVTSSVDAVAKVAADIGGYVGQSSVRRDGDRVVGDISIQVPTEKFNEAMSAIRGLAVKIESDKTTTQDVTDEFVDNEARLKNLKVSEEATQKLMDRADSMDKVLAIQRELTTIRGEIEKIQGRQNYLQRRVDVSTIKVQLFTEAAPAAEAAAARSGFEPGTTARVAWETSLNILSSLATVLITLFIVLWWVIPIILFVWWLVRRRRRNAKAKALALGAQAAEMPAAATTDTDHPEKKPQANPA